MKSNLCEVRCDENKSPPSRGAWIEIIYQLCQMPEYDPVAPLAGGVD